MADIKIRYVSDSDGAEKDIANVTKELEKQENSAKKLEKAQGGLSLSLTDLKSGLDLASEGLSKMKEFLDATAGKAAEWGDSMGDLAQVTGASVTEVSRMSATFELMGVQTSNLEAALKTMTKQGLQLNMKTIIELSKEYQALQDPVEKNEFLFKKFGKAGLDMAEILGKSADELKRLEAAAIRSGKVIGEDAANAAEEYNVQMAIMQQRVEGAQIAIGNALIPTLNKAAEGGQNLINTYLALNIVYQKSIGIISEQEAAIQAAALAGVELVEVDGELVDAATLAASATEDQSQANRELAVSAEAARWAGIAAAEAAKQEAEARYQAAAASRALAAGLSGTLSKAQEQYSGVVHNTATELAAAKAELEKYNKINGQTITVNTAAKFSQAELTLQAQKLAEAQAKLSENTDPEKQAALTVAVEKASEKLNEMNGAMGGTSTVTLDYKTKIDEAKSKVDELTAKQEAAALALQRTTLEFVYQKAAADLDTGAALELARSFGLIDEKSYAAAKSVEDARSKFDADRDGKISATEAAAGYTRQIEILGKTIAGLQDKVVKVKVEIQGDAALVSSGGGGGGNQLTQQRAAGGTVYAGSPYYVGEGGPEPFIPAQDGRILSRRDAMRAMTGNYAGAPKGGDVYNTFNINGAQDPRAVAVEVERILSRTATRADNRQRLR